MVTDKRLRVTLGIFRIPLLLLDAENLVEAKYL
jgi:hypothetical protein